MVWKHVFPLISTRRETIAPFSKIEFLASNWPNYLYKIAFTDNIHGVSKANKLLNFGSGTIGNTITASSRTSRRLAVFERSTLSFFVLSV